MQGLRMGNTTVNFVDAARLSGGPLSVTVKPCGPSCNLSCRYCYYLDKSVLYGNRSGIMSGQLLEKLVSDAVAASDGNGICFNWHGGEPLLAGLDFYRKALEIEHRLCGAEGISNSIQTNGTLITAEWAEFFASNGILVGVSVDGPRQVHDAVRRSRGGAPTFDKVMSGIGLLCDHGVEFNTMTAVSRCSEGLGGMIYEFLKTTGTSFFQLMPVYERIPGTDGAEPWSVTPRGFGRFLSDIFDRWVNGDVGKYFVNVFDSTLAGYCGVPPGSCLYGEFCSGGLTVERNGDVYPCDHCVDGSTRLGNLFDDRLGGIRSGRRYLDFQTGKQRGIARACLECKWHPLCHGECPCHRFGATLCEGYRMFYEHSEGKMLGMRELLRQGRPASGICGVKK